MKTQRWPRLALMAAVLSPLGLTACVVAPSAPPPYARYEPVLVAPPPPRVDVIGVAPYPGYVWIGGFWTWRGGRHDWVPGRWDAPRHGHRWAPHRWEQRNGHWREHPGRWERH